MSKNLGGIIPFLAPLAAGATAGLAGPALFGAEALAGPALEAGAAGAAGAGEAAGLGAAAPFFIPGTETAIPGISAGIADFGSAAAGASPFFIPGTDTPLPASSGAFDAGTAFGAGTPAAGTGLQGAIPAATQAIGDTLPSGSLGTAANTQAPLEANIFTSTLGAPNDPAGLPAGAAGSFTPADLAAGESDFTGEAERDFFTRATSALGSPAVRAGLAGGGLLASGLMNSGTPTGSVPLSRSAGTATTAAGNLLTQANQNLGALNTGALPRGAQSAIDQASRSAKATIRSQYAAMGLGNSTSEAQALAAVDQQAGAQRLGEAEKLTALGLKEAGLAGGEQALASSDYLALMNAAMQRDDRLANALARFSGSLAGGAVSQL